MPSYINHGLGMLLEEEHKYLIEIGAIKCNGEIDLVACDGFCVISSDERGGRECLFEGNQKDCEFEAEQKKMIFKNKKIFVSSYPKSYTDYYEAKNRKRKAWDLEDEAVRSLEKAL